MNPSPIAVQAIAERAKAKAEREADFAAAKAAREADFAVAKAEREATFAVAKAEKVFATLTSLVVCAQP